MNAPQRRITNLRYKESRQAGQVPIFLSAHPIGRFTAAARLCTYILLAGSALLLGACAWIDGRIVKHEVRETRQASSGELQRKRALLTSETALQQLDRVDVAVSVPIAELVRVREVFLSALRADKNLQKENITLLGLDLDLKDQEIVRVWLFLTRPFQSL